MSNNRTRLFSAPLRRRAFISSITVALTIGIVGATPASAAPAGYQFPVRPGTAEWVALKTHDDMLRVTQLPPGTAERLSTEALAETVLNYPLLLDALAFNDVQHGFETVAARFNGLSELLRRPNAGAVLLRRYQAFDARIPATATALAAGDHTYGLWKLEMLLAQPQVLHGLTAGQTEAVLKAGIAKEGAKKTHAAVYGKSGLEPTAVLLGRALAHREGWDWRESTLLREATPAAEAEIDQVFPLVKRHFAEPDQAHPLDTFGTQNYPGTVYTPRGTAVAVTVVTEELTSSQIASLNQWVASNYPNATRETNASRRYNCHSYAWHNQSTSNSNWMDTPNDDKYWNDGSYTEWHPPYIWFSGMRAGWKSADHSGINDGTSSYIRSKWGQLPRMRHHYSYNPYNSSTIYYYFRT